MEERKRLESQRGWNDTTLFRKCLFSRGGVDICLIVAIRHLLNTFPMPEEFLTGVLPPSARSQELFCPESLAGREPTCDHWVRGEETVGGQGVEGPWLTGVTAWVCSRRPPLAVGMQAQYWPHLPSVPLKAPNPGVCVKSSFEMWVTIQRAFLKISGPTEHTCRSHRIHRPPQCNLFTRS